MFEFMLHAFVFLGTGLGLLLVVSLWILIFIVVGDEIVGLVQDFRNKGKEADDELL